MIRRRFSPAPHGAPVVALAVAAALAGLGGSAAPSRPAIADAVQAMTRFAPQPPRPAVAAPARLRIPLLGVDAAVVPVATGSDGELAVPDDPRIVGWWQAGGAPGAEGAAGVLDGHVDTAADGPGALFRLAALRSGDAIRVESRDGTASSFVVRSVRRYVKAALPPDVFGPGRDPQLVLITCGGQFDHSTRQYADNIVVIADAQS